mgnify:CR=1 FL=1
MSKREEEKAEIDLSGSDLDNADDDIGSEEDATHNLGEKLGST